MRGYQARYLTETTDRKSQYEPSGQERPNTMRVTHHPGRRLEVPGGTAARVLDFTAQPEAGVIIIWHSDDPTFPADGVCIREDMPMPPPGTRWNLKCPDCRSEVVGLVGVPPEVAVAAFGVAHSPSCPWLTRVRLEGAA